MKPYSNIEWTLSIQVTSPPHYSQSTLAFSRQGAESKHLIAALQHVATRAHMFHLSEIRIKSLLGKESWTLSSYHLNVRPTSSKLSPTGRQESKSIIIDVSLSVLSSIMTLEGLISLWMRPRECKCRIPISIPYKQPSRFFKDRPSYMKDRFIWLLGLTLCIKVSLYLVKRIPVIRPLRTWQPKYWAMFWCRCSLRISQTSASLRTRSLIRDTLGVLWIWSYDKRRGRLM